MNRFSFLFAQIDIKDTLVPNLQKTSAGHNSLTLLFGALGSVTFLILLWAIFIRKRPDEGSRRYTYPSRDSKSRTRDNLNQSNGQSDGRRRRRRKRRSRNPTLAETGGLPPVRTEGYFDDPP
jgi:hypothetical protein